MKLTLSIVLVLAACGGDDGASGSADGGNGGGDGGNRDGGGDGDGGNGDGGGSADGGGDQCGTLRGVIRDFKIAHPDFEVVPANDVVIEGLVNATITPGGKPTLNAGAPAAGLITSPQTFADWYTDVPGTNMRFERDFALTETGPGQYVFDDDEYFPLDGGGFGNEGNGHNFHFTTELHASFPYRGGERFTFQGDDDVWVFVNGKLAIDIGGVHSEKAATIDFDARAADLGITKGNEYAIDFFQAERHVTASHFRIETTIDCFIIIF
jgi:fibro-slime domain-containing protein